jgi:iron complex outermembrane receptor protein
MLPRWHGRIKVDHINDGRMHGAAKRMAAAWLMTSAAVCGLLSAASPACAQPGGETATTPQAAPTVPSGAGLAEIVVTAQKRSENLQNVPIAITALGAKQLAVAQINTTADLKAVTPGLAFNTALGGFGQPRIRGVGTTTTGPGIENPVATYVDGVYIGSAAGTLFSLNDVDQVAVLKGPQGTLFGRNATGGLIQVTTRAPSQTPTADGSISYGNYGTVSSSAYVSGGLTPTLSASVAGIYDYQKDGYGTNLYNGEDVQKHRDYAGRGKIQWKPDSDTKFTLSGDYSYLQGDDPAIHPVDGTLAGPGPSGERDIDQNVQPYLKTKSWGASLTGQHDFSGVQLLSITAYRNSFLHAIIDADQTPEPLVKVDQTQKDKQFSQELQLLSTAPGPFKWVIGGYYFHSRGTYDPLQTTINVFGVGTITDTIESRQTLNSYAAFAQGTYDLGASTHLTAGLRYTIDDRRLDASDETVTPFGPEPLATADASKSFKKLTWRLSLDHRFSPGLLGYISYNRGFKSGSFVPQVIPAEELKPETLDAYEVGLKSDLLDHRVRINAAVFYYDYKNIQINEIIDGILTPYDGKGARSYGVDLDVQAKVTHALTLNAGFSYIHDRYKSFPNGYTTNDSAIVPPNYQFQVISVDATGNRLQDTPDWTANVGATYVAGPFTVAASYYYNDGYYVDPGNGVREPHYNLVDASVTWTSADKHLFVRAWGKNLTNALYSMQLDATSTGNNRVAAPPRTYGVTAGFHF